MTMADDSLAIARREIEALHEFLSGWLNGTLDNDDATFAIGIENRLDKAFVNIQPAGKVLSRNELCAGLRAGYGQSPDFRIKIRNVRLLARSRSQGLIAAFYEEYQTGARSSKPPDNVRLSTVLFRRAATGALIWLHVHETWAGPDKHDPALFDF
jgi:hypothetical protein